MAVGLDAPARQGSRHHGGSDAALPPFTCEAIRRKAYHDVLPRHFGGAAAPVPRRIGHAGLRRRGLHHGDGARQRPGKTRRLHRTQQDHAGRDQGLADENRPEARPGKDDPRAQRPRDLPAHHRPSGSERLRAQARQRAALRLDDCPGHGLLPGARRAAPGRRLPPVARHARRHSRELRRHGVREHRQRPHAPRGAARKRPADSLHGLQILRRRAGGRPVQQHLPHRAVAVRLALQRVFAQRVRRRHHPPGLLVRPARAGKPDGPDSKRPARPRRIQRGQQHREHLPHDADGHGGGRRGVRLER